MKKKLPIFLRYEFSDETGSPEGGDVFTYETAAKAQSMVQEILKVAHTDQVAVNITVGVEKPFFGFLKNVGLGKKEIEKEMVKYKPEAIGSKKKKTKK